MDPLIANRLALFLELDPGEGLAHKERVAQWEHQTRACRKLPAPEVITERDVLEAIDALTDQSRSHPLIWATFHELVSVTGAPEDRLRTIAARLVEAEVISGCLCGCRGDLSLDDAGLFEREPVDDLLAKLG